jgi:hypothetical protein
MSWLMEKIGVATGKTYAYYERRMISLASIDKEYAVEGNDVIVLWGTPGHPLKKFVPKWQDFGTITGNTKMKPLIPRRSRIPNFNK